MTFEIQITAGTHTEQFYARADSEAQALLKARAHARRTMSATAYRFATFTVC